jgi:hypothetical protein
MDPIPMLPEWHCESYRPDSVGRVAAELDVIVLKSAQLRFCRSERSQDLAALGPFYFGTALLRGGRRTLATQQTASRGGARPNKTL